MQSQGELLRTHQQQASLINLLCQTVISGLLQAVRLYAYQILHNLQTKKINNAQPNA